MNLPDHINPIAVEAALLNIGMTITEIRALTGDTAPQIIRNAEELEALDPDTLLRYSGVDGGYEHAADIYSYDLPAVVVTPAKQVRAARKAMEEA